MSLPGGSDGKASVYNAGDLGTIPGSGRFLGEGNGNPFQYSCLENPMDGGAWCRLLSMGSQTVGHDWATSLTPLIMSLMTFLNYSAMSRALNYPAELFHTYLEHSFTADNNSGRNIVDLKRIFILFRKSHSSPQIGEKKKLLILVLAWPTSSFVFFHEMVLVALSCL